MHRRMSIVLAILCFLLASTMGAQRGLRPDRALVFSDIAPWIADARPSMELFESVLKRDFFAARLAVEIPLLNSYFALEDGRIGRAAAVHASFQGMFWGPLFAFTVWTPTFFLADVLFNGEGVVAGIPMQILKTNLESLRADSKDELPFSKLLRFNVLFASDLVYLDFRQVGSPFHLLGGLSQMGRSYAGICMKILDDYNLFLGFNLLSFPFLQGYQDYQDANPDFASQAAVTVTSDPDSGAVPLYQVRSRFFVHTDLFDAFRIKGLFDFSSMQGLLDLIGLGASSRAIVERLGYADLAKRIRVLLPDLDLSYLGQIKSTRLTLYRDFSEDEAFDLYYRWDLSVLPFNPLSSLRAGLGGRKGILTGRIEALAALDDGFLFGGLAEARLRIPRFGSLRAALSWNDTGKGGGIPFYRGVPVVSLEIQSGMSDDLNPFAGVLK